jgi:septum formation topological specificity factor MinE
MNTKTPNNNTSDEVDLGHVFNAIGKLFERFFKFIGSIFSAIISFFILILKVIINNIVIIGVVVGLAFIVGIFTEQYKKPIYEASMLVKPYFDSKYQLVSSISYFNSLLDENRYDVLADIFHISQEDAKSLAKFEVKIGPETKNELLRQYDEYLKSLDSARAKSVTYTDFVDNRDIYSSELFLIEAKSYKRDVFRKLEGSIDSIFSNRYSIEQKKKRDQIIDIKKATFEKDLETMDTLRSVYLNVIQKEADRSSSTVSLQGLLPLQQEKSQTKEYEILQFQMRTRDSIKVLDQLKVEENSYYEVLSRFPEVGKKPSELYNKHWILFPILAFFILCIAYIMISTFKFIKNHA